MLLRTYNTTTIEPRGAVGSLHLNASNIVDDPAGETNFTVELCSGEGCQVIAQEETELESQLHLAVAG